MSHCLVQAAPTCTVGTTLADAHQLAYIGDRAAARAYAIRPRSSLKYKENSGNCDRLGMRGALPWLSARTDGARELAAVREKAFAHLLNNSTSMGAPPWPAVAQFGLGCASAGTPL